MGILNKNGVNFVVGDEVSELRVSGEFKSERFYFKLDIVILEDKVIVLNSSKSNRWEKHRLNPFLDKQEFVFVDNEWHLYDSKCDTIRDNVVDINELKECAYAYEDGRDYVCNKYLNTVKIYSKIEDDLIYESFEEAIESCTGKEVYTGYNSYDRLPITKLLDTFKDTNNIGIRQYCCRYTTLKEAIKNKYDIALIRDLETYIQEFIDAEDTIKGLITCGSGINKSEAIAYCNIRTGHTLIVDVNAREVSDNVIYRELNNYNIHNKGLSTYYCISKENRNSSNKKFISELVVCKEVSALHIAQNINSIHGYKLVFTSNPYIAYQLVTGKNVTSTGFWKDVNGNSLKSYFKQTKNKTVVTTEKTEVTKVEGISELIEEVVTPLTDSMQRLNDSVDAFINMYGSIDVDKPTKSVPVVNLADYEKAHLDKKLLDKILRILKRRGQVMLHGAPGTGKTYISKYVGYLATGDTTSDKITVISCSHSTDYGSCIEGLKPRLNGGFVEAIGTVYATLQKAIEDPDGFYVIILDESNRCDFYNALGEVFAAAESRGDYVKTANGNDLMIPKNIGFISIINTYDSGVIQLPNMIKSRFARIEIKNDNIDVSGLSGLKEVKMVWDKIVEVNEILSEEAGNESIVGVRQISYNIESIEDLRDDLETGVIPSIYDNISGVSKAGKEKINQLINDMWNIVSEEENSVDAN